VFGRCECSGHGETKLGDVASASYVRKLHTDKRTTMTTLVRWTHVWNPHHT
jgi:hypothetical protein